MILMNKKMWKCEKYGNGEIILQRLIVQKKYMKAITKYSFLLAGFAAVLMASGCLHYTL